MRRRKFASSNRTLLAVAALALGLVAASCGADETDDAGAADDGEVDYPTDPIELIVGSSPGGGNDLINRMMAPELSRDLGVPVTVENHVGGSGTVALMDVYAEPSDGHTLAQLSPQVLYINEKLDEIPFSADAYTMLGIVNVDPGMVAVPENSPYETMEDLVEAARGGELTAAISGLTQPDGIGFWVMCELLDIDVTPVVYDGAERDAAIQGGQVDFSVRNGGWYQQEGLRVLAVAHPERIEELPDVPTIEEATGTQVIFNSTRGAGVKSDTPEEVIERLEEAYEVAANADSVKNRMLDDLGFRWQYMSREEIEAEYLESQVPNADLALESDRLRQWSE